MGAYIARRLILMIPTLIGITFLVFMLVALAPGGIGAALSAAGGQMDTSSRAQQEAYLEDRYGLDAPVIVQYVRWLGRVSPVKFGRRDQITPDGEIKSKPKPIAPPVAWQWVAEALPEAAAAEANEIPNAASLDAAALADARNRQFKRAESNYFRERGKFIAARVGYEQALLAYAREKDLNRAITTDRKLRKKVIRRIKPDKNAESWAQIESSGELVLAAFQRAIDAEAKLTAEFNSKPYRQAGFGIIPGFISIAMPDLGRSFSKFRPVSALMAEALPRTMLLNIIAIPIIYLIAIPGGMLAAVNRGSVLDILSGLLFVGLWSIPLVWAGVLAIGFLANNDYLGWFPVSGLNDINANRFSFLPTQDASGFHRGYLLDTLWHLCLPVLCLVYGGFAVLAKQTRAALLDNLNADYVRTAKAKGVSSRDVLFRHVFRNSLLPLITLFATIFPAMLAGSVIVEKIFTIPGMGSLIIESIYLRDREVILANVLIIGGINILALLLADILYALADPRISYD